MDTITQIILIRGVERILIVIISGISIFLGWNLFRAGILNEQQGEIKTKDFFLKLSKVGPGIFFALFGSFVLIQSLYSPFSYNSAESNNKDLSQTQQSKDIKFRYLSEDIKKYVALSHSINTINNYIQSTPNIENKERLEKAINNLLDERNLWVISFYGLENFKLWQTEGYNFVVDPTKFTNDEQKKLMEIQSWMIEDLKS